MSATAKIWLLNLVLLPLVVCAVLYPPIGIVGSLGVIWWGWRQDA